MFAMSNLSAVDKTDDVPEPGNDSTPPQPVGPTVLHAADIPKASPEALDLLKSIGKHYFYVFTARPHCSQCRALY